MDSQRQKDKYILFVVIGVIVLILVNSYIDEIFRGLFYVG